MSLVNILGGAVLLTLGRRIFWIFVAVVGFFAGFELTSTYLKLNPEWLVFAAAIVIGLLGAALAYFLENVAIGVAGFFVGVYLGTRLLADTAFHPQGFEWVIILLAGVIGVILMYVVFNWALIILSSAAGASLVVEGFHLLGMVALVVGVVLFVAGILIQSRIDWGRDTPKQATNPGS